VVLVVEEIGIGEGRREREGVQQTKELSRQGLAVNGCEEAISILLPAPPYSIFTQPLLPLKPQQHNNG